MTEQELLRDCLVRLGQSGLNFMLVESMADDYWGVPRSSHDIDFVIEYESKAQSGLSNCGELVCLIPHSGTPMSL